MCDEIVPGAAPSYQTCKSIYLYHPLGAKMAESPVSMAQSQQREISVPKGPEEMVVEQFWETWSKLGADAIIFNVRSQSRVYGVASVAMLVEGVPPDRPIDYKNLPKLNLEFNVLDPLNTAGSLVLSQNPNALDFQKPKHIVVNGTPYHVSRTVVQMNEHPIYIAYSSSSFGYVGRSVYQRALFPLKSFVQSMITDDMVTRKAGVLVAKLKMQGSIIDAAMAAINGIKRQLLKEAQTNNVISVSIEEDITTLNMQNLDGAYGMARKDILENIAVSADMPAKLLNSETFAEGFGEGSEDAKAVARYIDRERIAMLPLYEFFDKICQYRAWTPEFYKTIQEKFPEQYGKKAYLVAFYDWCNSYKAQWPSLLTEPDSEKIKVEDTKFKAIISAVEVLLPQVGPVNRANVMNWMADNFNQEKMLFHSPLILDPDELATWEPPALAKPAEPAEPQTMSNRAG